MNSKITYMPGPSNIKENVRQVRSSITTNPDVDVDFVEFYKNTCDKIGKIINTKNDIYILNGEGILGLEAACASITEKGDRVLVIDNGIFGNGFSDFVKMYGGDVVFFRGSYKNGVDTSKLKEFLEQDSDFKYATIVHCDTPTGVLNNIKDICIMLNKYEIVTVVDSVSAMVGEELLVDEWKIDIILGASQKAISAQPGLTIVGISDKAKECMKNRKSNVMGFYCNLKIWENYYEKKRFPYTMPISDILSLNVAIDNILDEGVTNVLNRHNKIAIALRKALREYGLELFLNSDYSNTVTGVVVPENIGALNLSEYIRKQYNIIIGTSLGEYKDKILRIGHMGENARLERLIYILNVLDISLSKLGFIGNGCLVELFNKNYK